MVVSTVHGSMQGRPMKGPRHDRSEDPLFPCTIPGASSNVASAAEFEQTQPRLARNRLGGLPAKSLKARYLLHSSCCRRPRPQAAIPSANAMPRIKPKHLPSAARGVLDSFRCQPQYRAGIADRQHSSWIGHSQRHVGRRLAPPRYRA